MKNFWSVAGILFVLIVGYQIMKYTQLSTPGNLEMSGTVQHYLSTGLGIEFDYLDHIDNEKIIINESENFLSLGGKEIGTQSIEIMQNSTTGGLKEFIQLLLSGKDKKCIFEIVSGTYLNDNSIEQLLIVNKSPRKYLGLETGTTNIESNLCTIKYDTQKGLQFFAFNPETPKIIYFFSIGENEDIVGTLDLRTPWYKTLKFLTHKTQENQNEIGPISNDTTGHINLIKKYYKALESHDFSTAASLVTSGEKDAITLQNTYSKVIEFRPFKIEKIGDNTYHFYVRLLKEGAKTPSIYSLKKAVIDGKLKSIAGNKISTNTANEHFRYYSDKFIEISSKNFKITDLLKAEDLAKNECPSSEAKNITYFKKILGVFNSKDIGTKYTVSFKNLNNIREDVPGGNTAPQSANIYVIPNKIKYPNKEKFFEDFNSCTDGSKFTPLLISIDRIILGDGCSKKEKGYCNDIITMFKQTITTK